MSAELTFRSKFIYRTTDLFSTYKKRIKNIEKRSMANDNNIEIITKMVFRFWILSYYEIRSFETV